MRARAFQCLSHDIKGGTSRNHGPERTGDLELQIGARGFAILPGGFGLCPGSAGERLQTAAGVDWPLEIDPRLHAVGDVGVDQAQAAAHVGHTELLDVIHAYVARDRRKLRALGCLALSFDCSSRVLPGAQFLEPRARLDSAGDGLVQRQSQGRCLRSAALRGGEHEQDDSQ